MFSTPQEMEDSLQSAETFESGHVMARDVFSVGWAQVKYHEGLKPCEEPKAGSKGSEVLM